MRYAGALIGLACLGLVGCTPATGPHPAQTATTAEATTPSAATSSPQSADEACQIVYTTLSSPRWQDRLEDASQDLTGAKRFFIDVRERLDAKLTHEQIHGLTHEFLSAVIDTLSRAETITESEMPDLAELKRLLTGDVSGVQRSRDALIEVCPDLEGVLR
ncbi:MAG: hypothetical protein Q4B10_03955 [Actinomycetaceae bacterium]|nr:hypothetical protein [Actinomycetaceae bacterium]